MLRKANCYVSVYGRDLDSETEEQSFKPAWSVSDFIF